jgi:hypothetical protein
VSHFAISTPTTTLADKLRDLPTVLAEQPEYVYDYATLFGDLLTSRYSQEVAVWQYVSTGYQIIPVFKEGADMYAMESSLFAVALMRAFRTVTAAVCPEPFQQGVYRVLQEANDRRVVDALIADDSERLAKIAALQQRLNGQ